VTVSAVGSIAIFFQTNRNESRAKQFASVPCNTFFNLLLNTRLQSFIHFKSKRKLEALLQVFDDPGVMLQK